MTQSVYNLRRMPFDATGALPSFAIYDHPSDYPNLYVVRQWNSYANAVVPQGIAIKDSDIEVCREFLRSLGLTNIGRTDKDDAKIIEVWI